VLVGAVDGLGHGEEAAAAARIAVAILEGHAGESVITLFRRCHERLVSTRGAVMSLASFNTVDGTMTWLGVRNLTGLLLGGGTGSSTPSREYLLLRGGVVGYQLPELRAAIVPVEAGDTLIFATDGIRSEFAENVSLADSIQQIADRILSRFAKP